MPKLEQVALELAKGKVLDVGCGAGCHSLYLQEKDLEVLAMDISKGAVEVVKHQGISVLEQDVFTWQTDQQFDTILLLMNGTGICGTLDRLPAFLQKLSTLLSQKGQILMDSSDLIYMYEDENGDHWIPADSAYYGEVQFSMTYKGQKGKVFDWLYADYNTLQRAVLYAGLEIELIAEGNHYDYLARITKPN